MITYKDAGVDVERGYEAVRRMKQHVAATFDGNVLGGLGSFGGFYSIENENVEKPVLVAGTDGVGTKLKLAFLMDKHDTVGIDCVAMCVNDVVCQGAKPLIFLDYIATGYLDPVKVEQIVAGVAEGCRQAGCALIGGETAEMPDFYPEGEYDLAGFTVGIVGREKSISGERVAEGDVLVGMASSGVHSNGYSLVRKLVLTADRDLNAPVEAFGGKSWGETLLTPTKIYVKPALAACKACDVHGIAHITGGGFIENIPRILPDGLSAQIERGTWPVLPVFTELVKLGGLGDRQAYNTFNMGVGMVFAVKAEEAEVHGFEDSGVFEGCMPVEVMARRGEDTLRFGPLKPRGLVDPKTGREPYAVVQLRRDNADGTIYNLVGFQTHLKWGEQKRVFSMIPALHDAQYLRYGVMHRNTYLDSPRLLDRYYRLKSDPRIAFAGQMTGVEGYVESCASGFLAGIELARRLKGQAPLDLPRETAIGALGLYVSNESVADFQPMNVNFGIIPPLDHRVKGKRNKNAELSQRSLAILDTMKEEVLSL